VAERSCFKREARGRVHLERGGNRSPVFDPRKVFLEFGRGKGGGQSGSRAQGNVQVLFPKPRWYQGGRTMRAEAHRARMLTQTRRKSENKTPVFPVSALTTNKKQSRKKKNGETKPEGKNHGARKSVAETIRTGASIWLKATCSLSLASNEGRIPWGLRRRGNPCPERPTRGGGKNVSQPERRKLNFPAGPPREPLGGGNDRKRAASGYKERGRKFRKGWGWPPQLKEGGYNQ